MTPLQMIEEWRKSCSCASKEHPEECGPCTRGLIEAIERVLRKQEAMKKSIDAAREGCKAIDKLEGPGWMKACMKQALIRSTLGHIDRIRSA